MKAPRSSYFSIFLLLILMSCQSAIEKEKPKRTSEIQLSPIEKITYDQRLVEIKLISDSTFTTYSIDSVVKYQNYQISDKCNAFVSYRNDTLLAIGIRKNNINIFTAEYYPNHQIKGVISINLDGQFHGVSKYYYANGRVRAIGYWQNNFKDGEWRYFSEKGRLESKEIFDKGELVKTE